MNNLDKPFWTATQANHIFPDLKNSPVFQSMKAASGSVLAINSSLTQALDQFKPQLNAFHDFIRTSDAVKQINQISSALVSISESQKNIISGFANIIQPHADALSELVKQNSGFINQFKNNFDSGLQWFHKNHFDPLQRISEVYNEILANDAKIRELHQKDMLFVVPFAEEMTAPEYYETFLHSGESAIEVYSIMLGMEENILQLMYTWEKHEAFEERMEILNDALEAHFQKKFTLSIPALMGQLEGIILETLGIDQGEIKHAIETAFELKKKRKTNQSDSTTFALALRDEVFNPSEHTDYKAKGIYPHRPSTQHGINVNYYKDPHYSTRLILLIDYLRSDEYLEAVKRFKAFKHRKTLN